MTPFERFMGRIFGAATAILITCATMSLGMRAAAESPASGSAPPPPTVAAEPGAAAGGELTRTSWEFSPYRVQVYVKAAPSPDAAPFRLSEFTAALDAQRQSLLGGVWKLTVSAAPAKLPWDRADAFDRVTADQVAVSATDFDKIMLLGLTSDAAGTTIAVRELDLRTRLWRRDHDPQLERFAFAGRRPASFVACFQPACADR